MNKNAIKKFAIEARQKLIASVTDKAGMLGITAEGVSAPTTKGNDFEVYQTAAGIEVTLNKKQCEQRRRLVEQIETKGFEEVVEEVAYTWFNRICAIRFMEVNDYLPSRVRALSSEKEGKNEPDLVTQAPDVDIDFTEAEVNYIVDAKMNSRLDELFVMLFIKQCNMLNEILPELFEKTSDYTELLLDISYTDNDGVIQMLVNEENGIPESDFNIQKSGQVEIIGWLYQYYNEERKNEVININKGTVNKEDIPAATQLFTTDWVVRYMVDNSLGRYWIERNPNSKLHEKLEFFVTPKDGKIEYLDEKILPEELTFFDPCMGSGHILVYAFDVLMEIYRECGYSDRDAALNIVQFNLYGLDIDNRAYQLAYFAVMMKARSYNRRVLSQGIFNNLCAIQESNGINQFECEGLTNDRIQNQIGQYLIDRFKDAKEIGSLLTVEQKDYQNFVEYLLNIKSEGQIDIFQSDWLQRVYPISLALAKQASIFAKKYCVVATNPPYLGKMQGQLKKFITNNYKDYAGDLFATFMYRNFQFCKSSGYSAFMTPFVWMFIKTYEKLREYIIDNKQIVTLVQMEYSAFEEATVPICSFVLKNANSANKGIYFRLTEFKGGMQKQREKVLQALTDKECGYLYETSGYDYRKIPSMPIAYWVGKSIYDVFEKSDILQDYAPPRQGIATSDNNRFLRFWYEVDLNRINFNAKKLSDSNNSDFKWYPYNKGGDYRKWYGNQSYVVNWENDGYEIRNFFENGKIKSRPQNTQYFFKESVTWSDISSAYFGVRFSPSGFAFDMSGSSCFPDHELIYYVTGFLCSKLSTVFTRIMNPSIHTQVGNIATLPFIVDEYKREKIDCIVKRNIQLSKEEWDSYETSWNFVRHPLVPSNCSNEDRTIYEIYQEWEEKSKNRFDEIKKNEEENNKYFIKIYNVEDEIDAVVEDNEITVSIANVDRDIRSLISYAVGCMFGRFSLDNGGIIFAGGNWDTKNYVHFVPDKDNVIPITDNEYFSDDIVGLFCNWLSVVYGQETLEENLDFIAKTLGNKGDTSREIIRNYFLKDFISDHIKMYQKRPIYWLFDSGKEDGFKALIYMHRYTADTVGIIRTDYLHKTQKAIEQAMQRAEYTRENASSASDKKKAVQQITKYTKQLAQMKIYDEAMAHIANQRIEIDLDDGVKENYEKFQGVEVAQEGKKALKIDLLAKIK